MRRLWVRRTLWLLVPIVAFAGVAVLFLLWGSAGPRGDIEEVREDLTGGGWRLPSALDHLQSAADPDLWDGHAPTVDGQEQVFFDLRRAVALLQEARGVDEMVRQDALTRLLDIARGLADAAIVEATEAGGEIRRLARSREALARGDTLRTQGMFSQAVLAYEVAAADPGGLLAAAANGAAGTVPGGSVGVIGCSNTGQAVEGYYRVADDPLLWPVARRGRLGIGGGTFDAWAETASDRVGWWVVFDAAVADYGLEGLWVTVCLRPDSGAPEDFFDDVPRILEAAGALVDGELVVPVWWSALNTYGEDTRRPQWVEAVALAQAIADWAVANGYGLPGPVLGPLGVEHLQPLPDQHLNRAGEDFLGAQLDAFLFTAEAG